LPSLQGWLLGWLVLNWLLGRLLVILDWLLVGRQADGRAGAGLLAGGQAGAGLAQFQRAASISSAAIFFAGIPLSLDKYQGCRN
jgi:hypothetical protein